MSAKIEENKEKFKAKLTVLTEQEEIEIIVKVLQVEEGKKYCMEFQRANGDQMAFFKVYNQIKAYFGEFEDTVYESE